MIKTKSVEKITEFDPVSGEVLRKIKTKTKTTDDADLRNRENEYKDEIPFT